MFLTSDTSESFSHTVTGVFAKAIGAVALACAVAIPAGLSNPLKQAPTHKMHPDGPSQSALVLSSLRNQADAFVAKMRVNDLSDIKAEADMLALAQEAIAAMESRRDA